ncbi:Uncharacterised protein [Mycobacteroides abscessus subsp. abscessus]|nr:Uncharacterised protein [Mycobacteroides abscessus subsp. abscessus]
MINGSPVWKNRIGHQKTLEEALEAAVEGDYSVMGRLLNVLAKPYSHAEADEGYCTGPDDDGKGYVTYCGT